MTHLLRPRVLLAACAALVVVALIAVAAGSTDGPSPLSVSAGEGAGGPSVARSTPTSTDSTEVTSGEPSSTDETMTTTGRTGSSRRSTTTTTSRRSADAPTSTTAAPSARLTAPPAPDGDHITFWGQVRDEMGRPVKGACVTLFLTFRFAPPLVVRTKADGTYLLTVEHLDDNPAMYSMHVDSCPDDRLDLLGASVMAGPDGPGRQARGGEVPRTDFTMPLAPTTVDVDVVDPWGRPILGVCIGWYDSFEEVSKRALVDDRGRARIDRPGSRSTAIHLLGPCDGKVSYGASVMYVQAQLKGGPNTIRMTVPWSSGDDVDRAVDLGGWSTSFNLVSLSTEPGELDPSCVGSFTRSRWFRMYSAPFPGVGTAQQGGPIAGGRLATKLQLGGTFVIWGVDGAGTVKEVACAPAGTTIKLPVGVYSVIAIQVIPSGDLAQVGSFEWLFGPGS